ncbi:MAG: hypothetical protein WC951_11250 [Bacteroidales bacterium]
MFLRKVLLTIVLCCLIAMGYAQQNRYLNYRTIFTPTTSTPANKGALSISFQPQAYFPRTIDRHNQGVFGDEHYQYYEREYDLSEKFIYLLEDALSINDYCLNISYALSNSLSVGLNYAYSERLFNHYRVPNQLGIEFEGISQAFGASATFRNTITEKIHYEVGSSLMLGLGDFIYEETNFQSNAFSILDYNTFTHNFKGALTYKLKKIAFMAQLNTGYFRHFNISSYESPLVKEYILKNFWQTRTDFYLDPAIVVSLNLTRFAWHAHLGFPLAFGESRISQPIPTIGIGLSYTILQGVIQ